MADETQECIVFVSNVMNTSATTMMQKNEVSWCSFIWELLSSKKIHERYGEKIWRFIPITWRSWWLTSLQSKFPQVFSNLTLEQPFPVFNDKTADIKEWNDDINSYVLSRLVSAANKFLQPTIKCPWGCSEFQHKAGFLPLNLVL